MVTTIVTDLYCTSTPTSLRRTIRGRKEVDMIVLTLDNKRNVAGRFIEGFFDYYNKFVIIHPFPRDTIAT